MCLLLYSCLLCCRLVDCKYVGVFLGSLFCSIDLCMCFYVSNMMLFGYKEVKDLYSESCKTLMGIPWQSSG